MATVCQEKRAYRINLHMHTTDSDGRKTPEEAAVLYRDAGYDAVAITDHWVVGAEREISGLKVFSGCEYNFGGRDTRGAVYHIQGLFYTEDPGVTREDTPDECIRKIHAAGGLAILAHPAWSLNQPDYVEAIERAAGFDATEIYNTVSGEGHSTRPYSGEFVDLMASRGVFYPLFSSDDVHYYERDAVCGAIVVELPCLTREALVDAIRRGDFYATRGGAGAPWVRLSECEGGVRISCSPASRIDVFSNLAYAPNRHHVGEGMTELLYEWHDEEAFLRVEVTDAEGRVAYSQFMLRKDGDAAENG